MQTPQTSKNTASTRLLTLTRTALVAVILTLTTFTPPAVAIFKDARCSIVTQAIWDTNYKRCFDSYMASAKFHKDTKAEPEGKRACDCVANELVNNLTCAEIRKYDGDTKYRATQDKRIVDLCTKK